MNEILLKNLSFFKLIAFDVTGTLANLRHSPGAIYERVARDRFGYKHLDPGALDKGFRRHFKALAKEYPNYGKLQGMHWRSWWSLVVQGTFRDASDIDPKQIATLSDYLIDLYETPECWTAPEQSLEFVHRLKELKIRTGIITNSDPRTEKILKNLGFPKFDVFLSAFDVGVMKPNPEIFQMAFRDTPHLNARQAMFIGNDPELDYAAAKLCSWQSVLVKEKLKVENPEQLQFKSLCNLINYLSTTSVNW